MRPRPHNAGTQSPNAEGGDARRIAAMQRLVGREANLVPNKLATGAKDARARTVASDRKRGAKLDIMAKRRTDQEQEHH